MMAPTSEYPASTALGSEILHCWNCRNLDRLLSTYHPDAIYTSPRVAEAFAITEGIVGSPDGTVRGFESLRDYFEYCMRAVPNQHFQLLHQPMRGLGGCVAIVYSRNDGAVITEMMKLEQGRVVKVDVLYSPGA